MPQKLREMPIETTPRIDALMNMVITVQDLMTMYNLQKTAAWRRARKYCVCYQRQRYGTLLIYLPSVLEAFGQPINPLPPNKPLAPFKGYNREN